MKQLIHEEKTQTTCVLRLFGAPLWAVQQAVQQTGLAAQCRSRGAETLAALQAETPAALSKARKALADRFAAELYGEGEMTLVHAAVQALETHHRLLVCCDADAGTLLEARMETVAGAEKVFDFGAMSYPVPLPVLVPGECFVFALWSCVTRSTSLSMKNAVTILAGRQFWFLPWQWR